MLSNRSRHYFFGGIIVNIRVCILQGLASSDIVAIDLVKTPLHNILSPCSQKDT